MKSNPLGSTNPTHPPCASRHPALPGRHSACGSLRPLSACAVVLSLWAGAGLALARNFTHLPAQDPQWDAIATYAAHEPADFDAYWAARLAGLPPANPAWSGGAIDIGGGKSGSGVINWNGASTSARKPCLIMLPSAGAAPGTTICPGNANFILASAMGVGNAYKGGTSLGNGEYTEAILAVQQMIRNIQASGKCNGVFYVIGKSQGGGMSLITAGLCPAVLNVFASVPALTGFTGSMGTTGAFPGYPVGDPSGYLDALNHAKRINKPCTFSISYNDDVTWGRGQVTAARNTLADVVVHQGRDGHGDGDWWPLGTAWLNSLPLTPPENSGMRPPEPAARHCFHRRRSDSSGGWVTKSGSGIPRSAYFDFPVS